MNVVILFVSPWIFGVQNNHLASNIFIGLAFLGLLYSFLTNYELGGVKAIPMTGHLFLDFVAGIFMAASPWLFDFSQQVYLPHVIFGLLLVVFALMTDRVPFRHEEKV